MDNRKRYGGGMRPLWTLAGAYLLYLAFQQGRLVAVVSANKAEEALRILRSFPVSRGAAVIGP